MNEADTCRKYVVPKLQAAGWENEPHSLTEQKSFTDGRILIVDSKARRQPQKRVDYLLRCSRDTRVASRHERGPARARADRSPQARPLAGSSLSSSDRPISWRIDGPVWFGAR